MPDDQLITVYYDGACEKCIRDRKKYEAMAGDAARNVQWFDITGQHKELKRLGIDPGLALTELHVRDTNGNILSELDAYILLMRPVPILAPLTWLIGLPLIRPLCAALYHRMVMHRLQKEGRLQDFSESGREAGNAFECFRCLLDDEFLQMIRHLD